MIMFGAEAEATFFARLEESIGLARSASAEPNDQPAKPLHAVVVAALALVPLSETVSAATQLTVAEVTHSALIFDMASRYPMVLARISRFEKLERGWNGPNTAPPTRLASTIAVHIVRDFAKAAMALAVPADPQVAPLDDGGYQFEWHYRDRELYVACGPNGVLSILESAPGYEREYTGDRTALQNALHWFFANQ